MTNEKEKTWNKLDVLYQSLEAGITREKYLRMCEQLGKEPNPDKIPPDWDEFPEIVSTAVNIFNSLGDRVYPEIGYIGKDYTNLNFFIELYDISDKHFLMELLLWLDQRAIKKSSEDLKREYDKLKRKNSGQQNPSNDRR